MMPIRSHPILPATTGGLGLVTPSTRRAGTHIEAGTLKLRTIQSLDVTALAWILMRTSPCLGVGSFTSLSWSTSGDPYLVQTAAFMSRMLLRGDRS